MWSTDGMILTGGKPEIFREKLAPVPLWPSQIPYGIAWDSM
jgi:hypothetical protein